MKQQRVTTKRFCEKYLRFSTCHPSAQTAIIVPNAVHRVRAAPRDTPEEGEDATKHERANAIFADSSAPLAPDLGNVDRFWQTPRARCSKPLTNSFRYRMRVMPGQIREGPKVRRQNPLPRKDQTICPSCARACMIPMSRVFAPSR